MPKKILKGTVVSDKMEKTVVIAVDVAKKHPLYTKAITKTKRYKAHDELGVKEGTEVIIEESRPYSKEVTWIVKEVVEE
ncbi:30S ribosomal protein S17 [candidate division WWE3 bacterium]|nr:30S ribosomal protein S17 [candidate division WWE3 bacterium]